MILVFGSINIDLVARVSSIPRPGETVMSPGYEVLFGGKGANQAVAAARASNGSEVAVAMVGRVGDDAFGRAALANLEANGVSVELVTRGAEPTGCAFIVVEESGENAITVASGANGALTAASASHVFTPCDVLVLQMEVPFGEALAVARRARSSGARVIWNFAPAPAAFTTAELQDLLNATDIFVVNEHEALAAARLLGNAPGGAGQAAEALVRNGGPTVILTAGRTGATAVSPDGGRAHAPALAIDPVDTTGAGDTFVGVLAAGLVEGQELSLALPRACLAASLSCLKSGAQAGMPDRAALEQALPLASSPSA
jgi:ribokinase